MFKDTPVFTGFSVDNLEKARKFYVDILGLNVTRESDMGLVIHLNTGGNVFVYSKIDHIPATYTMMNFIVDDIDTAVAALKDKGVVFEHYENSHQDDQEISRGLAAKMGPDIAWFTDPAGNILSVLQEK